jgi:outer membrane biosynthesis protein TonB
VYSGEDDQMTDPDGKAGSRIGCGVVNAAAGVPGQPAASPVAQQPGVPKPVTSPVAAVPPVAQQPVQPAPQKPAVQQPAPQQPAPQLQASPKPATSPVVVQNAPPVVVKPATSPVAGAPAVPAAASPVAVAVPTAPVAAAPTTQSGGGLGPLPALLIAIVGVGLVGAGYLLRRRSQMRP